MRKVAMSVTLSNEAIEYVNRLSEYRAVSKSQALEMCVLMTKLYYNDIALMETDLSVLDIPDGRRKEGTN